MSNNFFAGMPSINIPRSRWNTSYNITGSHKHGFLIPVDGIPVLPGDSIACTLKDITRMQTPIAPIFGNIKQSFAAFFVPLRLVWEHTEQFFGANKVSAGYQTSTYYIPTTRYSSIAIGSPCHYFGKPYKASASEVDADGLTYVEISNLKERAYYLIWNEYFRAQQITNPVLLQFGDNTNHAESVGTWNGSSVYPNSVNGLMRVAKMFDYFTASTISPQYGGAVTLPLGTTAPLTLGDGYDLGGNIKFGQSVSSGGVISATSGLVGVGNTGQIGSSGGTSTGAETAFTATNLYANLENATAAKINDIRYAFAVQKYLERANFAGNYFFGILQVHYGVTSPDSRLQRPEFLGEFTEDILIHQVVSTSDTTNSGVKTSVGNTGAMSVTASGAFNLFNKAFVEPGFVILLRWCRHRQVYCQGVMREDFKKDRFEIYTPELCNLGDQATLTRELYWKAGERDVFGYQEHWAEYRYRPDRVTGMLDPVPASGNLPFWTLANNFTQVPQLDDDFILERRTELDRALTTGSTYDEYITDTWINLTLTREMPVRTIPGLIDHFGAM